MILPANEENIKKAAFILKKGGLVAFPTETVYGLGADGSNPDAVRRIFEAKKRPSSNPLILHIGSESELCTVADTTRLKCPTESLSKLKALWPAPFTMVLPALACIPKAVTGGKDSVAVRIPAHPVALALIRETERPIAAPSANISTRVSATTAKHVEDSLGESVDLILDGGPCEVGVESTILSLLEWPPRILRPGGITPEQISSLLGVPVEELLRKQTQDGELLAPGMMKEHYAPHTKLIFRKDFSSAGVGGSVGLISFGPAYGAVNDFPYKKVLILSETGDLEEIASNLFSALRQMDKDSLDLIVVDCCEEEGIGLAIMDRLRRAAAKFR